MTDTAHTARLDCGKTIEELADYVADGRTPRDPDIETCPECANVVEALERVSHLSQRLIEYDARELEPSTDSWIDKLLVGIEAEIVAGRSHQLTHPDPRVQLFITDNALQSHLRAVSDELDNVILGRCEIIGDFSVMDAPVVLQVSASVSSGSVIPAAAERLRRTIATAVQKHTGHPEVIVNITVTDIHVMRTQ